MSEPGVGKATNFCGPVSTVLEAELRTQVRRNGIVLWLDLDGHYSGFVDGLISLNRAGLLPYDVRAFRGSYLRLLLSLEGIADGVEKPQLVVHLPGLNEETVKETPLLELYEAGVRYRKALDTLVTDAATGRIRPDQIAAFKAQGRMTLDAADHWLAGIVNGDASSITSLLRDIKPKPALDDLLSADSPLAHYVLLGEDLRPVWDRWTALVGLPAAWRDAVLPRSNNLAPKDVAFAVASWAIAVEYGSHLRRAPTNPLLTGLKELPRGLVETCQELADHLRKRSSDFYVRTADETETLLADEVETANAADLGDVDTFRFEEEKVLKAALEALGSCDWETALRWAVARIEPKTTTTSFWLQLDPTRLQAWRLVHIAARLGHAIQHAGERLEGRNLEAAVETYVERGVAVDQAHRHMEQQRAVLLYPQLAEFEVLRERLDAMRVLWRRWADAWARDFNAICRSEGFLPSASLQQRTLFDEVVRPLVQEAGITAYFVIDAFRFEMAEELSRQLSDVSSTSIQLKARLAELPSITAVGMNALAPVVVNGRLTPVASADGGVRGFSTGEFQVVDPESRKRAMHHRVGGRTCPLFTLGEVVNRDSAALKRSISSAKLLVVHSQEIDEAGENGLGPVVFDQVVRKLRAAWHLLRDAGVRRFVFTSDHGFLLQDETSASIQTHGRRIDPHARYVFSSVGADHAGETRVALEGLGYGGMNGYVMFPDSTATFDIGRRRSSFVHGGNSLQERAIPVLSVVHRASAGGVDVAYAISANVGEAVAGMHCLDAIVSVASQHALQFGGADEIELALQVPDRKDIQVELCQVRRAARIASGSIYATVGQPFELFFRLSGPQDERVLVELYHASAIAEVGPFRPESRFAVTPAASPTAIAGSAAGIADNANMGWLADIPEWVRQVFQHLAVHGSVTEDEATKMLDGPRNARRLAVQFEDLTRKAPFGVRIDVVSGVKRYVREGNI